MQHGRRMSFVLFSVSADVMVCRPRVAPDRFDVHERCCSVLVSAVSIFSTAAAIIVISNHDVNQTFARSIHLSDFT